MRPNRGFTLVELLVVIAIIGILIALLLPAVQAAREAARRMQCANNMKQVALAVHSFHDAHSMLPSSRTCEHHATWLAQILPYLDERSLADRWNIEKCFYDQPEAVRTMVLPMYLCPSRDTENVIVENIPDNVHPRHGKTPYKGCVCDYACTTGTESAGAGHLGKDLNGALIYGDHENFPRYDEIMKGWKSRTDFDKITDGLSQTFLAGETSYSTAHKGTCAFNGDHSGGILLGPSYPIVHDRDTYGFGSDHPGVCQFMLLDGSVQSVAVGTSATLLGYMVTRAGGEVVDGERFQ